MTTRPIVSIAQLDALEAAAAGVLIQSQRRGETYPHWRIELDEDIFQLITRTADSLLARRLIRKGTPRNDGSIAAELTETGRAILDDLASRTPSAVPEASR